ncbi:DUF2474 domain-containing protein [Rosenbergiella epipactidis]|uniref:DUF2474 domain-containing protein n=1 Tax=Rosenbergiella epipactidis TaxID=1544694 RepID=UPI0020265E18|nr:DUF2474 domain-containing protein [Rosenbergiella epipactidis]MCL9668172.1 DUF2474 domain-containing protein [Rosenbergiella epipactidis]
MKGITELAAKRPVPMLEGAKPSSKLSQLRWLLLIWLGSIAALGVVAVILWLLMHSAGMTR